MNKVSRNTLNFLNKWDFKNKFFQVPRDRLGLRDPAPIRAGLRSKNLYNILERSAPSTPPRRPLYYTAPLEQQLNGIATESRDNPRPQRRTCLASYLLFDMLRM